MGWTSSRTARNTLHVVNSEDGSHFEAADEDEAQANIDAIRKAQEEAERAAAEEKDQPDRLTPAGSVRQPDSDKQVEDRTPRDNGGSNDTTEDNVTSA